MNCKPGDLAYLVKAMRDENVGRVVEVLYRIEDDLLMGPMWKTRACVRLPTTTYGGTPNGMRTTADCPDWWLRPISGVPVEDEQYDEVKA